MFISLFGLMTAAFIVVFRKVLLNAFLGLVLILTDEINLDDRIEVKGRDGTYSGIVAGIGFKNLKLKSGDTEILIIHEQVYESDVKRYA